MRENVKIQAYAYPGKALAQGEKLYKMSEGREVVGTGATLTDN